MNESYDNQRPLAVDDRQLATILAAMRFHQAENLQGAARIPDRAIEKIATDSGRLTALDFDEVENFCRMLNTTAKSSETFSQRSENVVQSSYCPSGQGANHDCDSDIEPVSS